MNAGVSYIIIFGLKNSDWFLKFSHFLDFVPRTSEKEEENYTFSACITHWEKVLRAEGDRRVEREQVGREQIEEEEQVEEGDRRVEEEEQVEEE